jgi:hypothetical protein
MKSLPPSPEVAQLLKRTAEAYEQFCKARTALEQANPAAGVNTAEEYNLLTTEQQSDSHHCSSYSYIN